MSILAELKPNETCSAGTIYSKPIPLSAAVSIKKVQDRTRARNETC